MPKRLTVGAPRRMVASALLATGLLGLTLATTAGREVAADFLGMFRVEKFTVVTYDPNYPVERFTTLGRQLGTVTDTGGADRLRIASSLSEASLRVGFEVTQPGVLPAGASNDPIFQTLAPRQVLFTLNQQRAQQNLLANQGIAPTIPPDLEGAGLQLNVPSAAVVTYLSDGTTPSDETLGPLLVVAQGPSPALEATGGATLEEMRAFLLSTPDLPADAVQQVSNIDDWTATLPVPVPAGRVAWQETQVNGTPALLLADSEHVGSALVWKRGETIYTMIGQLDQETLLATAESMP